MAIQFLLCLNKQGVVRLLRWFVEMEGGSMKHEEYIRKIFRIVSQRDHKYQSNFVELSQTTKLIYKRYAGLFFIMGVDLEDDELIHLSHIHFFVEVLDAFFENVCELDILFNFHKAYMVMDEMFLAGEIQETSKERILERIKKLDRLN